MDNVQNKTAIVTGGGSGIGYCITEQLLRNGAKRIAIIDLPLTHSYDATCRLQEKYGKERVVYFPCDITNADCFKAIFLQIKDDFDKIDILVNNAGMLNDRCIEQTFAVNVIALIRGSMLSMDYMGKHKGGEGGTIVNIASISALMPWATVPVYSSSKYAVLGFSMNLKEFYDKSNVRVLTMCPSFTITAMNFNNKFLDIVDEEHTWNSVDIVQPAENVGHAVVELIQNGKNGEIWTVANGEPPKKVEIPPFISSRV